MIHRSRLRLMPPICLCLGSFTLFGCGEDAFETPDVCRDLPRYDIGDEKNKNSGAVSSERTLSRSSLSLSDQQKLIKAADAGCITLPGYAQSLPEPAATETPTAGPIRDAGINAGAN